jgi:hypothetical protein
MAANQAPQFFVTFLPRSRARVGSCPPTQPSTGNGKVCSDRPLILRYFDPSMQLLCMQRRRTGRCWNALMRHLTGPGVRGPCRSSVLPGSPSRRRHISLRPSGFRLLGEKVEPRPSKGPTRVPTSLIFLQTKLKMSWSLLSRRKPFPSACKLERSGSLLSLTYENHDAAIVCPDIRIIMRAADGSAHVPLAFLFTPRDELSPSVTYLYRLRRSGLRGKK